MADFKISRFKYSWRGTWQSEVTYNPDDVVRFGGKVYTCIARHLSNENFYEDLNFLNDEVPPKADPRWELTADGVALRGDWQPETFYRLGDVVKLGGINYICVSPHTSAESADLFNQDLIDNRWSIFVSADTWIGDWTPSTIYSPGSLIKYSGIVYRAIETHVSSEDFDIGIAPSLGFLEEFSVAGSWKGDWQRDTIYFKNDIVRYGGNVYICDEQHRTTNSLSQGIELTLWKLLYEGVEFVGEWSNETYYRTNDVVRYGAFLYKSLLEQYVDEEEIFNEVLWSVFCPGQTYELLWNEDVLYQPGDIVKHGGWLVVSKSTNLGSIPEFENDSSVNADWDLVFDGTNVRGDWNKTETYKPGDVVRRNGYLYTAIRNVPEDIDTDSIDQPEISQEYWRILLTGTFWRGAWKLRQVYFLGDLILWKGATYKCIKKHISDRNQSPEVASTLWEQYTYGDPNNALEFVGDIKYYGIQKDGSTLGPTSLAIGTNGQTLQIVSDNKPDWKNFTESQKVYYVTLDGVDRKDRGLTLQSAWRTVRYAVDNISGPATIFIGPGTYDEILPFRVPKGVAVVGNELRSTNIRPIEEKYQEQDINFIENLISYFITIIPSILRKEVIIDKLGQGFQDFSGGDSNETIIETVVANLVSFQTVLISQELPEIFSTNEASIEDDTIQSVNLLNNNLDFIEKEFIGYAKLNGYSLNLNNLELELLGERLINALTYDLTFSGNYKIAQAAFYYINGANFERNKTSDMFLFSDATGLRNLTLSGLKGTLGNINQFLTRRPTAGAYASLNPGWGVEDDSVWIINQSPYIQNVTTFGEGCVGLKIDGTLHNGGNKSIVSNDFTQILSDGIGIWANRDGLTEAVSVFTYYNHIGYLCTEGGKIRGTNGNCSYGQYGAVAEEFDPTEEPITGRVNNRFFDATVREVFTDGNQILKIFFNNAGQDYTTAEYALSGTGGDAELIADEFRDGGVFEGRLINPQDSAVPGGSEYTLEINNAQAGNRRQITFAASLDVDTEKLVGLRVVLRSGTGSGQYGYIVDYNNTDKIALISDEYYSPAVAFETKEDGNKISLSDTSIFKVGDAIAFTGNLYTNLSRMTVYFITDIDGNDITISTSAGGIAVALVDELGDAEVYKLGWGHLQSGTPSVALLDTTTSYAIEPRVIFEEPPTSTNTGNITTSTNWSKITFGNEKFVAVSGNMGFVSTVGAISDDAISWNAITLPEAAWNDVKYGNKFVAVGNSGKIAYSNSGESWAEASGQPEIDYQSVAYSNNVWIAVASGGTQAARSSDGITWQEIQLPEGADWKSIAHGKGTFVAIAQSDSSTTDVVYSKDAGNSWIKTAIPGGLTSIAYGNNRFVAISGGYQGAKDTFISFDGITWIQGEMPGSDWQDVTYGQGVFVAVSFSDSAIARSTDGLRWKTINTPLTDYTSIAFGNPNNSPVFVGLSDQSDDILLLQTGIQAQARVRLTNRRVDEILIWEPGSNYQVSPEITIFDNDNVNDAFIDIRIADGVLANPTILQPGQGWQTISSRAIITGDGFADRFQRGKFLVVQDVSRVPGPGDNLNISGVENVFTVLSSEILENTGDTFTLQLTIGRELKFEESPNHLTEFIIRQNYSQVRLTGHDFLDIGLGNFEQTNYPNTLFPKGTVLAPEDEVKESGGGRVFYTSTDQDGNFRVGELFAVEQATGIVTISAEFFDLDGLSEIALGGVSVGGSGVVVREFSTDPLFTADSNNVIPTQRAIKSFLARRISGGGSDTFTTQFTAGIVRVGPTDIDTTTNETIQMPVKVAFNAPIDGAMLVQSIFLAGQGFVSED